MRNNSEKKRQTVTINPTAINLNYNDRQFRVNILNFIKQKILLNKSFYSPTIVAFVAVVGLCLVAGKLFLPPLTLKEKPATKRLKVDLMV